MKTALLIVAFFVSSYFVNSQTINTNEVKIDFKEKSRTAISSKIDLDTDIVVKYWKKYLKKNHLIKLKGSSELYAEKVLLSKVSNKTCDIYNVFTETETGTEMFTLVSYGYDIYLNSKDMNKEYIALDSIVTGFVKNLYTQEYLKLIKATEKKIVKKENEKKSLVAENKSLLEDISKLEKKLEEAKKRNIEVEKSIPIVENKVTLLRENLNGLKTKYKNVN